MEKSVLLGTKPLVNSIRQVVIDGTGGFKGCRRRYCLKAIVLSCQLKIQDGAWRGLGT